MILIRILLITIAVLYIIRLLVRLLLPLYFKNIIKKAQQQGAATNYNQQSNRPEGSIRVDYIPHEKKNQVPDSEGEFVEFEEVKQK